jgi:UDP:flavonoid glycosyltransferase YjiC (YdhE family)
MIDGKKSSKVVMLTIGSRSDDVQPSVSLALGLMDRGYDVKIVTHKFFEEFVTKHNIVGVIHFHAIQKALHE